MYDFMYVGTEAIPVEEHFPGTKQCVENYNKITTPLPVPKYLLVFSNIRSEDYELDNNFEYT